MPDIRVRVLFFGVLKDLTGHVSEDAEFPQGATLGDVLERYASRHAGVRGVASSLMAARNQEFAPLSTQVEDGDEVAFLPPVSGGTADDSQIAEPGRYFGLTRRAIDSKALAKRLIDGSEGAVVTFEGTTRNNTKGRRTRFLEYEAYEPLALKTMAEIGREIAATREVGGIAIVHRLGRVLIGDTAVAIVVTAPHRRAAFEGALEAINRVKKTAPIWKKEFFADGEVWVEGERGGDAQPR